MLHGWVMEPTSTIHLVVVALRFIQFFVQKTPTAISFLAHVRTQIGTLWIFNLIFVSSGSISELIRKNLCSKHDALKLKKKLPRVSYIHQAFTGRYKVRVENEHSSSFLYGERRTRHSPRSRSRSCSSGWMTKRGPSSSVSIHWWTLNKYQIIVIWNFFYQQTLSH